MPHHFLRERVENSTVKVNSVPSANNFADILTKAFSQAAFDQLQEENGLGRYQSPAQGEV
jgi:hypothetical protein